MSVGAVQTHSQQGWAGNLAARTTLPDGAAFSGQGQLGQGQLGQGQLGQGLGRAMAAGDAGALRSAQSVAQSVAPSVAGPTTDNPRLVTAAHQFEAAMMQEILGPLTEQMEGKDGLTGDEEDDGGPMQALTSFASEALGEALSQRGGFGIADSVLRKLRTEVARRHPAAPVAGTGLGQGPSKIATVGKENSVLGKTHRE